MVAAVFNCFQKWKSHLRNYQKAATDLDPNRASLTLVRAAQRESLGCVIDKMQSGVTYESAVKLFLVSKLERWMFYITKFVPFLDQSGILRMGRRLTEYKLSDEQAQQLSSSNATKSLNCLLLRIITSWHTELRKLCWVLSRMTPACILSEG